MELSQRNILIREVVRRKGKQEVSEGFNEISKLRYYSIPGVYL